MSRELTWSDLHFKGSNGYCFKYRPGGMWRWQVKEWQGLERQLGSDCSNPGLMTWCLSAGWWSGGAEKWSKSDYSLKEKSRWFTVGLNVGCEINRSQGWHKKKKKTLLCNGASMVSEIIHKDLTYNRLLTDSNRIIINGYLHYIRHW